MAGPVGLAGEESVSHRQHSKSMRSFVDLFDVSSTAVQNEPFVLSQEWKSILKAGSERYRLKACAIYRSRTIVNSSHNWEVLVRSIDLL